MKVIVISNMKGGVGKSTLSVLLAHAMSDIMKVAILDTDPQKTTYNLAKGIEVYTNENQALSNTDLELLIVDTPPYISQDLPRFYDMANLILMPMQASYPDYNVMEDTASLINDAIKRNKGLKASIVINMNDTRTVLTNSIVEQIRLKGGLPIMQTMIELRVDYKRAIVQEEGIYSLADKKAHKEFNMFTKEVLKLLL